MGSQRGRHSWTTTNAYKYLQDNNYYCHSELSLRTSKNLFLIFFMVTNVNLHLEMAGESFKILLVIPGQSWQGTPKVMLKEERVLLFVPMTWRHLLACNAWVPEMLNTLPRTGQSHIVKNWPASCSSGARLPSWDTLSQMSPKPHLKPSICSMSFQSFKWRHVKC